MTNSTRMSRNGKLMKKKKQFLVGKTFSIFNSVRAPTTNKEKKNDRDDSIVLNVKSYVSSSVSKMSVSRAHNWGKIHRNNYSIICEKIILKTNYEFVVRHHFSILMEREREKKKKKTFTDEKLIAIQLEYFIMSIHEPLIRFFVRLLYNCFFFFFSFFFLNNSNNRK